MPVFLAVIFNLFGGGPVRANLVINPTFDSSITTHLNAAIIENTISNVIAVYQASFSDPVTVAITFYANENISLGASSTWYQGNVSYSSIRSNLLAGATTVNDFTALAHLRNTTTNPVNGSTTMELTLPNGRALGFAGNFWNPPSGQPDGDIYLKTSIMNLTRTNIDGSKYDLYAVVAHEIDEVLGLSSALNGSANGAPAPAGDVGSLDLFRYEPGGTRSFNTGIFSPAWFSLDGTNLLVQFNQTAAGDYQDWYSYYGIPTPRIQNAFVSPGLTPDFTVELIALDVIGYHFLVPAIAIANAGTGTETVSWSPDTPGFLLQENTNLLSTNWLNSASYTNNPVTMTNSDAIKFFRVFHP